MNNKLKSLAAHLTAVRSLNSQRQFDALRTASQALIEAHDRNVAKLTPYVDRLRDALGTNTAAVNATLNEPKVRGYLFSAGPIVKIDTAPHGGDWKPLIYQEEYRSSLSDLRSGLAKEVMLLRDVYENARQLVRFYGVDKERSVAAGTALDSSIEAVKNFDGGTDE